jgi:CheY-like chemotaxis protein
VIIDKIDFTSRVPMANSLPAAPGQAPRILIVEDQLEIALQISETVRDLGYSVSGIARTSAQAHQEFAKLNFDAVLLDINLDDQNETEAADFLLKTDIPFAFVTGYDYVIEPRHEKIPLLEKPFTTVQLNVLLEKLVGPGQATGIF